MSLHTVVESYFPLYIYLSIVPKYYLEVFLLYLGINIFVISYFDFTKFQRQI